MSQPPARGWLVDTNVVSELREGARAAAEIRFGIERVLDPAFRAELDAWVRDGMLPWFGDRILEVDERVLVRWRRLVWDGQKVGYTYVQPQCRGLRTCRRPVVQPLA